MARGWHYTKPYISSALLLYFSGMCFVLLFLSFCRFRFVLFSCSRWIFGARCSSDRFLSSRLRTGLATNTMLLGMVKARSVYATNTKTTTTTKTIHAFMSSFDTHDFITRLFQRGRLAIFVFSNYCPMIHVVRHRCKY